MTQTAAVGRDYGDETKTNPLREVIDRLEQEPKQGVSYDDRGRHGWRNPIRQDTGPVLQALMIAAQACSEIDGLNVLEIGTARGLSMCHLALYAPECQFTTIEWDEEAAQQAKDNFAEAGINVDVRTGDAMKVIDTLVTPFNVVFLDANKDGYLEQIQKLKSKSLLAHKCLIIADNVIDRQAECQNFLDYMASQDAVILQIGMDPTQPGKVAGLLVGRL